MEGVQPTERQRADQHEDLVIRVLVVDDDSKSRFALTKMLEDLDAEVTAASTGREALEWLRDHDAWSTTAA